MSILSQAEIQERLSPMRMWSSSRDWERKEKRELVAKRRKEDLCIYCGDPQRSIGWEIQEYFRNSQSRMADPYNWFELTIRERAFLFLAIIGGHLSCLGCLADRVGLRRVWTDSRPGRSAPAVSQEITYAGDTMFFDLIGYYLDRLDEE